MFVVKGLVYSLCVFLVLLKCVMLLASVSESVFNNYFYKPNSLLQQWLLLITVSRITFIVQSKSPQNLHCVGEASCMLGCTMVDFHIQACSLIESRHSKNLAN